MEPRAEHPRGDPEVEYQQKEDDNGHGLGRTIVDSCLSWLSIPFHLRGWRLPSSADRKEDLPRIVMFLGIQHVVQPPLPGVREDK